MRHLICVEPNCNYFSTTSETMSHGLLNFRFGIFVKSGLLSSPAMIRAGRQSIFIDVVHAVNDVCHQSL